jgi:cellobiose dehydrogenase (acceptor)
MRTSTFFSFLLPFSSACAQTFSSYTDSASGIVFWQAALAETQVAGGLQLGLALPDASSGLTDEYIGHIVAPTTDGAGWTGLSHLGSMTGSLLLVAWVDGTDILTSFRYASYDFLHDFGSINVDTLPQGLCYS